MTSPSLPRSAFSWRHLFVSRSTRILAGLWIPALLFGCASAAPPAPPEPTEPVVRRVRPPDAGDMVAYRELDRGDFRADQPPPGADRSRGHVAAATCAYLVPNPELRFRAVRKPGELDFTAEVVDLGFSAVMDPACSWWDAESRFRPDDYVLEHEQIHFALFELAARDLNQRADALSEQMRAVGETGEVALAEVRRRFDEAFNAAVQRTAERSQRFDQETSLGFQPEAQARWAREVEAELAATGDSAPE